MLSKIQINQVKKWPVRVRVVSGTEEWITDGKTLYRFNPEDAVEPTQTMVITPDRVTATFGSFKASEHIEETGCTFDMHLLNGKGTVSVMIAESDGVSTLFFVDTELLKKVRPRSKSAGYFLGRRDNKKVLYNTDRTIGVCCIEDDRVQDIVDKYKPTFAAMLVMAQFEGESL